MPPRKNATGKSPTRTLGPFRKKEKYLSPVKGVYEVELENQLGGERAIICPGSASEILVYPQSCQLPRLWYT